MLSLSNIQLDFLAEFKPILAASLNLLVKLPIDRQYLSLAFKASNWPNNWYIACDALIDNIFYYETWWLCEVVVRTDEFVDLDQLSVALSQV